MSWPTDKWPESGNPAVIASAEALERAARADQTRRIVEALLSDMNPMTGDPRPVAAFIEREFGGES